MAIRLLGILGISMGLMGCLDTTEPAPAPAQDEQSSPLESPALDAAGRFCSLDGCDPEFDCCRVRVIGTSNCFYFSPDGTKCA